MAGDLFIHWFKPCFETIVRKPAKIEVALLLAMRLTNSSVMRRLRSSVAPLAVGASLLVAIPARAEICVLRDPNDAYVNVRSSPNGAKSYQLVNGTQVKVVGYRSDSQGRPWALIVHRGSADGYVFARFTRDCVPGRFTPY